MRYSVTTAALSDTGDPERVTFQVADAGGYIWRIRSDGTCTQVYARFSDQGPPLRSCARCLKDDIQRELSRRRADNRKTRAGLAIFPGSATPSRSRR